MLFVCVRPAGCASGRGTTAAIMSGTATVLQQFVSGLKSRNEDTRAKAAKDLLHYVTTELREVGAFTHDYSSCLV